MEFRSSKGWRGGFWSAQLGWLAYALAAGLVLTGLAWAAPPSGDRSVQGALARAVSESEPRLGQLDPWKKRIFDEEVVPQYSRFIKDYRPGANGLVIEIDYEAILRYIAFYAPRTLKPADSKTVKIALFHKVDPTCERCMAAHEKVRSLMIPRVDRRGFQPFWISQDDLPSIELSGPDLFEKVLEVGEKRGAIAVLVIETRLAPIDAIDSAHADERKFIVETYLLAKPLGDADLRFSGQLEVMESDPIEQAAARLLSDAFSQFGQKALLAERAEGDSRSQEFELALNGVKEYSQFMKLRQAIINAIPDAVWVEERKMKRGRMVLGIRSNRSLDAVKRQLAQVHSDAGKVVITSTEGDKMEAEVR